MLELAFDEAVTELWSVDSQYSAGDGVIVQVTGCLQSKARSRALAQPLLLTVMKPAQYTFRVLHLKAPRGTIC